MGANAEKSVDLRVVAATNRDLEQDVSDGRFRLVTLRRTGGNKSRAAELLGLDRKTLYRRLDEYRAEGVPDL